MVKNSAKLFVYLFHRNVVRFIRCLNAKFFITKVHLWMFMTSEVATVRHYKIKSIKINEKSDHEELLNNFLSCLSIFRLLFSAELNLPVKLLLTLSLNKGTFSTESS